MTTGIPCAISGIYKAHCCGVEVLILRGNVKPVCPICNRNTIWDWERRDPNADSPPPRSKSPPRGS